MDLSAGAHLSGVNKADGGRLELDAQTMRRLGERVLERVLARVASLADAPAWRHAPRAQLAPALHEPPPAAPADPFALIDELCDAVLPLASSVDHPRFLAYVPGAATWPGVLGDWLAVGYNIFAGTWQSSAGPSQLELTVLDWFRQWIGYPASAAGLLTSGGSAANLDAIVCARESLVGASVADGVVYLGAEAHSSLLRALRIAGFPADQVRVLAVDEEFRLPLAELSAAIRSDRTAGRRPLMVCANAGSTSTGAVDPLPALAELCAAEGMWLHVDAAYAGFTVLCAAGRVALAGIERADSVVLDPHKWLYQPFEAGCVLVRDGDRLRQAFRVLPDYLQDTAVSGAEVNFADRGLQLTRSARAIKIWLSLKTFGVDAFAAEIRRTLELAEYAAQRVADTAELESLTAPALGVLCFRRRPPGIDDEAVLERINRQLLATLANSGLGLISSTRVRGRFALRVCPIGFRTTASDVARVIDFLARAPLP
ncbi:MAG: pyridoxal phosphate-dependent decarboxylase family protein [Longimicrobiales bacterium]